MLSTKFAIFFTFFIIVSTLGFTNAAEKSYIVYMGAHSHGPNLTKMDLRKVSNSHIDFLASYLGSKKKAKAAMFYSYRRCINGFAANFDESVANEIRKNPNVVSVFINEHIDLHTTHSWDFLSLENNNVVPPSSLWKKAKFGEDIVIGSIDGGVWPESKSFSDEGYGPIPSRWKGYCQKGADPNFSCNKKLIGAKYFKEAFEKVAIKPNSSQYSPRDYDGHGSHTLSTAGGNIVPGVSLFGVGNGTAKGGAPRARVAAYKVSWIRSKGQKVCLEADLVEAFDHAIYDGVDVITASLGSPPRNYLQSAASIGAMNAVKHGIVVVMSAGNNGPDAGTVSNLSPWIITVGASTIDREFQTYIELGNGLRLKGTSIVKSLIEDKLYPIVGGAQAKTSNASSEAAETCEPGTLDYEKVKGKIVICFQGAIPDTTKGVVALNAGAMGMILCGYENDDYLYASDEIHFLPASMLTYNDCLDVFAYINSTNSPMGTIKSTRIKVNTKPAPIMASFSSRGPNTITPEILKPDITAPGVDIIAAYTQAAGPTDSPYDTSRLLDTRRLPYVAMSGTSMSTPHVSGVVALLRAIYPKWSPAAIRSAIMTTATTSDNSGQPIKSNPFGYGAGHIRPDKAADPGLIYDLHMEDYLNFLCVIGYDEFTISLLFYRHSYKCPPYSEKISLVNLNYPSITVPKLNGSVVITRTLKNVGPPGTYTARIRQPNGVSVAIHPNVLEFKKTSDEKSFNLTLTATTRSVAKEYVFGELEWFDGVHRVRSPITVATI